MQFGFNLPLSGPMASPAMLARLAGGSYEANSR